MVFICPSLYLGGSMESKFLKRLSQIFDGALTLLLWISACCLILVVVSVMIEVFMRYFLNRPQEWVVEFSEYSLLYITFLSCPYILKKGGHITVDIVISHFGSKKKRFLSILQYVLTAIISSVFLYIGAKTTLDHYVRGIYNPTVLQIPMAYVLMVIPIGGFFLFVQSLIGLYLSFVKLMGTEGG
jgi:C4-dicarboxylate transporter DctQ subunit